MKHLGDISKINGAEIEPVDIITFGSPCQDLSVAGKRAGLEGARSGLFMEAVRIIKEMREATDGKYPRFALWENVPGAFSSNKGEDFRVVLEELIKIVEPTAVMPAVPKKGWAYADSHVGDGWSIAYRVFDAQYWPRTPQRRRRIYLVADFRGQCAREILFEREGLRGDFTKSGAPGERVTAYVEEGAGTADADMSGNNQPWVVYNGENITNPLNKTNPKPGDPCHTLGTDSRNYLVYAIDQQGGKGSANYAEEVMPTLCSDSHGTPHAVAYGISSYDSNAMKSANPHSGIYEAETSRTLDLNGGNPACNQGGIAVVQQTGIIDNIGGQAEYGKISEVNGTLRAGAQGAIAVAQSVAYSMETFHCSTEEEKVQTLKARDWKDPHVVAYGVDCRNMNEYPDLYPTLQAKPNGGQSLNFSGAVRDRYIVRRLTPTECARLQGFPDKWGHPDKKENFSDEEHKFWLEVRNTHAAINGKVVKECTKAQMEKWYGKLHSDSSEYKMWGNGIALPTALYVMQGIAATR